MVGTNRRLGASLIVAVSLLALACSSGAPVATPTAATAPTPSAATTLAPATPTTAPAVTAAPATDVPVATPTVAAATAAPANATDFHLVVDEGPMAGTYDVTSIGPADCSYVADLDKWNVTYLGPPPLTFVSGGLSEDLPSLLFTFNSDTPEAVYYRALEDVTYDVDDTGTSATITVHADALEIDFADGSPSLNVNGADLTVECSAPFRYE